MSLIFNDLCSVEGFCLGCLFQDVQITFLSNLPYSTAMPLMIIIYFL